MPKIINTYSPGNSSLGEALSSLGNTMWGPQALQAGLVREKTKGLQITNEALPQFSAAIGSGDWQNATRLAPLAGVNAADLSGYGRYRTYNDPSVPFGGQEQTRATLGAGGAYGSTIQGTREAEDMKLAQYQYGIDKTVAGHQAVADNTPVSALRPDGTHYTTSRRAAIEGQVPLVLSATDAEGIGKLDVLRNGPGNKTPEQLKASGALPADDKMMNWRALGPNGQVLRGRVGPNGTDAATGQPLPPNSEFVSPNNSGAAMGPLAPDNTEQRGLRGRLVANTEMVGLVDQIEKRILADPTVVGPLGQGQKLAQNAVAFATDISNALGGGKNVNESLNNVRQEAVGKYGPNIAILVPELFKNEINEVEVLNGLLVYKAAAALASQEGRDLSDRDVAGARHMVGDPTSWLTSSKEQLSKLGMIKNLGNANIANLTKMLGQQNVTAGAAPPPAAPAPAPAPAAPQGAATRIKIDLDGNIVQ
jgi:hypothetical protein